MVYFKESYIALGAVGVYPNHSIYDHPARGIYWDRLGHKQVKCPPIN